jgi:hypothetical protein
MATQPEEPASLHPLDVLRSGRWTRALFGTFTLSLGFFEAAPLRALRAAGTNDIRILADVVGVAGSLGEAGAREVGRSYAIDAVEAPGGCFHPKFVLLDGEMGPRLIIGSGNLTFGGWGRNLELVEILSASRHPAAFADMADFLEALATSPRLDVPESNAPASWVGPLRRSLDAGGVDDVRLLHNVERPIAEQIAAMAAAAGGATGLLVASPYFGAARAVRRLGDMLGVGRIQVHVATELALAGRHYGFANDPEADPVVVQALVETPHQRPLHAKLIEVRCRDAVLTVSGSVNASGPALSSATNVELAVVRRRDLPTATRPFLGALPPLPPEANAAEAQDSAQGCGILLATLVGGRLAGVVMGEDAGGTWAARLDAGGEFRDLGEIEVEANRRFEIQVRGGDQIGFGTRRAILVLTRPDRRVAGFVTFPDLLDLQRRFGASAGSMIRVVGGSSEDEDLAGVLEYFARHPEQTAAPWSANSAPRRPAQEAELGEVALHDLSIRPRAEAAPGGGASGSSAIDRLIAALRPSLMAGGNGTGGSGGGGGSGGDDPDEERGGDTAPPDGTDKTDKVFETLCEAFAARVDMDPQTELHRLAELALCVLARRPDAARLSEFVSWWTALAAPRLRCDPERSDLRRITTLYILIDAMGAGLPLRARRRIAMMVGPVEEALDDWRAGSPPLALRLVEQSTAGRDALDRFLGQVLEERSPLEDLPPLIAAIRGHFEPPPLPRLDVEPEMRQLRRRILAGHADRVPIAGPRGDACPGCGIRMPECDLERLRSVGLVAAHNCCARIVVLDPSL